MKLTHRRGKRGQGAPRKAIRSMSPGKKAQHTAKWARIMTKQKISYFSKRGATWRFAEFGGRTGAESAGIIDFIAVRKNHKRINRFQFRGDLLELVLIQVKGGSAPLPSAADVKRLRAVAARHAADAVVLAEWKRGKPHSFSVLHGHRWRPLKHLSEVFG